MRTSRLALQRARRASQCSRRSGSSSRQRCPSRCRRCCSGKPAGPGRSARRACYPLNQAPECAPADAPTDAGDKESRACNHHSARGARGALAGCRGTKAQFAQDARRTGCARGIRRLLLHRARRRNDTARAWTSNSRSARWLRSGSAKRPMMLANHASEVPQPSNSCCTRPAPRTPRRSGCAWGAAQWMHKNDKRNRCRRQSD